MAHNKWVFWGAVLFWTIFLFVFLFYAPVSSQFVNTYQLNPTGTLVSGFWSFHFVVVAMYVFLWIVPLSLAFAIDDTVGSKRTSDGSPYFPRQVFHIVVIVLCILWYFSSFVVECTYFGTANIGTTDNAWNPANDDRWCCVYYTLGSPACYVNSACATPVAPNALVVNSNFLYQWAFNLVTILLLLADLVLVTCLMIPSYSEHVLTTVANNDPLTQHLVQQRLPQHRMTYKSRITK